MHNQPLSCRAQQNNRQRLKTTKIITLDLANAKKENQIFRALPIISKRIENPIKLHQLLHIKLKEDRKLAQNFVQDEVVGKEIKKAYEWNGKNDQIGSQKMTSNKNNECSVEKASRRISERRMKNFSYMELQEQVRLNMKLAKASQNCMQLLPKIRF